MAKIPSLRFRIMIAVIAGLAIVAFVIYFLNKGVILTTAPLAKTSIHALPDQSHVVLNDGSSIEYVHGTWEAERNISLIGEAYVSVKKGNTLEVKTANGSIEVLGGARFNVRAWGDQFYVECYEGTIKLSSQDQETILSTNQSINVVNGQMEAKQTINHQKPLWSTGNSRFYKENINQVFAELERQYAVIVNAPTMNQLSNGTFRHDDLEAALKSICTPMELKYEIDKTGRIVTIKE